jgi:hypothetical protein
MARAAALSSLIPLASLSANLQFGYFQSIGARLKGDERPVHGGSTMAVKYTANRNVAGLGTAPALSAFSAMVHIISADRYKLLLRLGLGDGALPKSAKMRQKAPFARSDSRWPMALSKGDFQLNQVESQNRDKGTCHRQRRESKTWQTNSPAARPKAKVENATSAPTGHLDRGRMTR